MVALSFANAGSKVDNPLDSLYLNIFKLLSYFSEHESRKYNNKKTGSKFHTLQISPANLLIKICYLIKFTSPL